MKLRIEDNSIRFRITPEELGRLNSEKRLESAVQIFNVDGSTLRGEFIYALAVDTKGGPTRCRIEPSFIMFILNPSDLDLLNTRGEEGFVYRRDSRTPGGETRLFTACVEVDGPCKHRDRPSKRLYSDH